MSKKSLDALKNRKEALQDRLKAVQEEIKRKEAAKATREASQAKKTRTHALILMGTLFGALIKYGKISVKESAAAAENYYTRQIKQAQEQPPKKDETPEKHAQRIQRQAQKLERDRDLLVSAIKAI